MRVDIPTISKWIIQLFSYFWVGLTAAIVEWGTFWLCSEKIGLKTASSTAIAFILATGVNWIVGRKTLFKKSVVKNGGSDMLPVFIVSAVGLVMNLILMWIMVSNLSFPSFPSKIAATCIVFFWNFWFRKKFIYKI